jgi:hypothetical protein
MPQQTRQTLIDDIKSYKSQIKQAGERMPAISKLKKNELLAIHEGLAAKFGAVASQVEEK